MTPSRRGAAALAVLVLFVGVIIGTLRARPHAQAAPAARTADFFPVAAWYGGGKARAPMQAVIFPTR